MISQICTVFTLHLSHIHLLYIKSSFYKFLVCFYCLYWWCPLVPEIIHGGAPEVFLHQQSWKVAILPLQCWCDVKPNQTKRLYWYLTFLLQISEKLPVTPFSFAHGTITSSSGTITPIKYGFKWEKISNVSLWSWILNGHSKVLKNHKLYLKKLAKWFVDLFH